MFLGVSWVVVEMVTFLTERAGLPDWTPTMAFVAMLLGLPVVVATAFVQEGAPGQEKANGAGAMAGAREATPSATASDEASSGSSAADMVVAAIPAQVRPFLTWRNAIMGGLGAFTLLGIALVGYFVMWSSGIGDVGSLVAQGVIEEGDPLVLADFEDNTGQDLGGIVTEAIRVDLQESSFIELVPPGYVQGGMARMGMDPSDPFTGDIARELAQRDGLKAVIQGEVGALGSNYLLTASIVAPASGEVLKSFRVPVDSQDDLLAGIDKLSQDIRERSGESLRSIRAGAPLASATTSSLEALRVYTDAVALFNQGRQLDALPLLEEAVTLDPDFAMAWRKMAVIMSNRGIEADRMKDATQRAYDLRHNLTEREALLAEAWYRSIMEENPEAAIEVYERMLERYPNDGTALNNLAVRLLDVGGWEDAAGYMERVVTMPGGGSANSYMNLSFLLWNVGDEEGARAWRDSTEARYPGSDAAEVVRVNILALEGDYEQVHDIRERSAVTDPPGSQAFHFSLTEMFAADMIRGRYSEGMRHLEEALQDAVESDATENFFNGPGGAAVQLFMSLDRPDLAAGLLERFERELSYESVGPRSGTWATLAGMAYMADELVKGDEYARGYERSFPSDERGRGFRGDQEGRRALRGSRTGDWEDVLDSLTRDSQQLRPCYDVCPVSFLMAQAMAELGQSEAALAEYAQALNRSRLDWGIFGQVHRLSTMARYAALLEETGDTAGALEVWQEIVELTDQADGPFIPLAQNARSRVAALSQ